ncbi:hypothetical protein TMatcc_005379 [Talaromyces marneffei ATCC 18224]
MRLAANEATLLVGSYSSFTPTYYQESAGQKQKMNPRFNAHLSDSHRLGHGSFAAYASFTSSDSTCARLALKDLPEFQALVCSSCCKHLTIRTQTTVQNTSLMSGNLDIAHQSWVAPDAQ